MPLLFSLFSLCSKNLQSLQASYQYRGSGSSSSSSSSSSSTEGLSRPMANASEADVQTRLEKLQQDLAETQSQLLQAVKLNQYHARQGGAPGDGAAPVSHKRSADGSFGTNSSGSNKRAKVEGGQAAAFMNGTFPDLTLGKMDL